MTGQFELPGPRARVLVTDHLAQRGVDLLRETPGFDVDWSRTTWTRRPCGRHVEPPTP